ncbi:(d)CMP kinase [Metallumcola ferriviriculae]|uniref:Cytidylate kinase n=1 Tax=Metallumcola ferriviriculae TaxID=3039180 RepID=A0AAU0URH1_9FIRM|nr:(d)CMP kinase [Desulfitibacteraceae bacterium MK1]
MYGNVAIDGPAGAGKSTAARMVAERLGYIYIDTGAMYRALTWKVLNSGSRWDDEEIIRLAAVTKIEFSLDEQGGLQTICDGSDVSREIRERNVSANVSRIARIAGVRRRMVELQRRMAAQKPVVMDGRDIGSFVLPDAPHKFFLIASLEERTRRRCRQMEEQGIDFDRSQVSADIKARDEMDRSRTVAPLVQAADAKLIDTDCLTLHQVVALIIKEIRGE